MHSCNVFGTDDLNETLVGDDGSFSDTVENLMKIKRTLYVIYIYMVGISQDGYFCK